MIARNVKPILSFVCLALFCGLVANVDQAQAQRRRDSIPDNSYFQGFFRYYQGEYRRAGKIFDQSPPVRTSFRSSKVPGLGLHLDHDGRVLFSSR